MPRRLTAPLPAWRTRLRYGFCQSVPHQRAQPMASSVCPFGRYVLAAIAMLGVGLAALSPHRTPAQVNIEPLSPERTGWHAQVGANFTMEANETVLLEVDLSPRVDFTRAAQAIAVVGNVGFSERGGTTFRNLFLLHGRYARQLSPTVSAELFARAQRDAFAALSRRLSSGAGVRFKVAADEQASTYAGLSVGVEGERWDVEPADRHPETVRSPRAYGYLAYRVQITETTTLLNAINTTLRLAGGLDEVRVTDTATLQVGISEQVALTASFELAFDNRPPRSQPQVSLALKNGLTIRL